MGETEVFWAYLFSFVGATGLCLWAAWQIRTISFRETRRSLTAFFSGSGAWAACYVGFLLSGSAEAKHFYYQTSLIVGFATVFTWLWFCSAYSGRGLHHNRKVQWFAVAVYAAVTILKVTNPLHGMYYGLEPSGSVFGLVVTHGTLYWVVMALAYALSAAGYLMLFEVFLNTDGPVAPLAGLTGLTALPAALNVIGHLDPSLLDVTHEPIGVAIFAIGLSLSYRYHFSVVRVARGADRPTIVIRPNGDIRDLGGGAAREVPGLGRPAVGKNVEEVLPGLQKTLERSEETHSRNVWATQQGEGQQFFRVTETTLNGENTDRAVVLSNVTEQERRRRRLARQNDLFEKAQDLASVGAWEYEVYTGELTWSEEVYSIYGLPEGVSPTLEDALAPYAEEDRVRLEKSLSKAIRKHTSFDEELRLKRPDGEVRWVRVSGEPQTEDPSYPRYHHLEDESIGSVLPQGDGEALGSRFNLEPRSEKPTVVRVRGAVKDITDQKRRERESRRLQKKYESLLEGAPDAIVLADLETGRIEEVNQEAVDLIGAPRESIRGRQQITLHPSGEEERYRALFKRKMEESKETGEAATVSKFEDGSCVFVETDEGEKVPVEIRSTAIDVQGEPIGVGIFRDISQRRRREQVLEQAKSEAEEASQMKSAMLANMSHEIRTPLTSIIGFAEAIGEEIDVGGQVARFADLIGKSGNRLLETLDAVLNLSKLEAGQMELEEKPLDLRREAKTVAKEFGPDAEEKSLELTTTLHPAKAKADRGAVQIVLQNLISNAIKYTEPGGRVEVRTGETEGSAMIEVVDTGAGMDPETARHLLEPFRQASEGFSREYEGTGVGLAVTKKATEQMGGRIDIETEKGEGTRLTVFLPRESSGPNSTVGASPKSQAVSSS